MKRIIEINGSNYASTGNIMLNIAKEARKEGFDVYTFCNVSRESKKYIYDNQILFGSRIERILSEVLSFVTGLRDHFNIISTYNLIKHIKKINPDLIHLHVLHDNFINYKIFFNYLSKTNIPIIWTFHDCSAFTGQCPYFDMVNCNKWKNGCHNCKQMHIEPKSLFLDTTKQMWKYKKNCFNKLKDLTIVTPSKWLSELVKHSYLNKYDVKVINNGINLDIFKPTESDFIKKHNLENKYIILGIANFWGKRKGLDVFIKLAKELNNNYQIVLVGTNDNVDNLLPSNIISIHRTYNQKELVKIYSSANVFANPTREENFPTVNIEALACGLPIVTFNTGGSPEIIDKTCGIVVEKNNVEQFKNEIINICENNTIDKNACLLRAKKYDMQKSFKDYINLYKEKLSIK